MKLIEKVLLFLFVIAIPTRLWSFEISFFIYAVDLFGVFLLIYYIFSYKINSLNSLQVIFIIHIIWILIISLISFFLYKSNEVQLLKGFLSLFVQDLLFIYFFQKLNCQIFRNYLVNVILITSFIIVPLSLINFYTNSHFGIDFILEFIKFISIGNLDNDDKYLKLTFWIRNSSFAGEPNFLGMYFVFILQLFFLIIKKNYLKQIFALTILLAIYSTFSRAAIICGSIVYIFWTFYNIKFKLKKENFIFIILIVCTIILSSNRLLTYNEEIENLYLSLNNRDFTSDNTRFEIYNEAMSIFFKYPIGIGPSNYSVFTRNMFGFFAQNNPHNSFLTTLVEEGIIGIIILLVTIFFLIRKMLKLTNLILTINIILFFVATLINDFYKITGYKFFIFFIFYISINKIKYSNIFKN
jgi:hypothetical protein